MIAATEHFTSSERENVRVLMGGIAFLLAFLPAIRFVSLTAPVCSPRALAATLLLESVVCLTMLMHKVQWRRERCQQQTVVADRRHQVEEVALGLFLREIVYYCSWIRHSRGYVPARITEAIRVDTDTIKLVISGSEYLFTFESAIQDDGSNWGKLDLSVDDVIVLSVSAALSQDRWEIHASRHTGEVFVEGPWVDELLALSTEARECRRTQFAGLSRKPAQAKG